MSFPGSGEPLQSRSVTHEIKIPRHPGLVEALGHLVIAHTHLELALRYTVKTLAGISVTEALDATSGERISDLRQRVRQRPACNVCLLGGVG